MTYIPIDWIATTVALLGMYILPSRKRAAIVMFLIGNLIWLVWGMGTGHYSVVFYYVVMGALNARTLITWMREARAAGLQLQGAS